MSEHSIQELLVEHYGPWVAVCKWVYPIRLRQWMMSFAPVRGKCHIRHGNEAWTEAESESDSSGPLMFACGHCSGGFQWRPGGSIRFVEDRHKKLEEVRG